MISVSITNIFILYVGIIILCIIGMSLFGRRRGKVVIEDRGLFTCPVCAYQYIIKRIDRIHRCPQCESLNTQIDADKTQITADKR